MATETTQIGPYQIRGELGRGGMGVVYLGWDPRLEREVAIKVLPLDRQDDPELQQRFLIEARSAARFQHSNILPIYDVGEHESGLYLVMQRVDGPDLRARLADQSLPWDQAEPLLRGLAAAIDHAHQCGLVHRDLKPDNVLLGPQGQPLLTDFGIARLTDGGARGLTATGMIIGTPEYMSPEQAAGQSADFRSDLYSFGVIAYQMLAGQPPFRADSAVALAIKHLKEPPPDPRAFRPDLPEGQARALVRMLAKDPGERFGSAIELVEALAGRATAPTPAPGAATSARNPLPAVLLGLGILAATLCAAIGLGAMGESPGPKPETTAEAPLPPASPVVVQPTTTPEPPPPDSQATTTPEPPPPHSQATTTPEPPPPAPAEPNDGWVTERLPEVGLRFRRQDWPRTDKWISSGGYEAPRRVWKSPDAVGLSISIEWAAADEPDPRGWAPLHERLRDSYGSRYACLAVGPLSQHGEKFDLWEYVLTRKGRSVAEHFYKIGGYRSGFGFTVFGACRAADYDLYGKMIRRVVGSVQPD